MSCKCRKFKSSGKTLNTICTNILELLSSNVLLIVCQEINQKVVEDVSQLPVLLGYYDITTIQLGSFHF